MKIHVNRLMITVAGVKDSNTLWYMIYLCTVVISSILGNKLKPIRYFVRAFCSVFACIRSIY